MRVFGLFEICFFENDYNEKIRTIYSRNLRVSIAKNLI